MKDKILNHIKQFRKKNGYAPDQIQIAEALKTTKQNVHYHIHRMKDELSEFPEYKKLFDTVK